MKAFRRSYPPPQPAGLDRTPHDAQGSRWLTTTNILLINTKTRMFSGALTVGDWLKLLKGNDYMAMCGGILLFVFQLGRSRRAGMHMKISGAHS